MNSINTISNFIRWILLVISVCLIFSPPPLIAEESSPPRTHLIHLDKSNNTISIDLAETELSYLAKILSKEAGIKIFLDESIADTRIKSKFSDMPLEQGIKRLVHPFNTAFVFIEDKNNKNVRYRIESVKICKSENQMTAKFMEFDERAKSEPGKKTLDNGKISSKNSSSHIQSYQYMPGTHGAFKRETMLTRANLESIYKKYSADKMRIKRKIAELNRQLNQASSPDERAGLIKELTRMKSELARLNEANSRMIISEEKQIRELTKEESKTENRKKFVDRQRLLEKQKDVKKMSQGNNLKNSSKKREDFLKNRREQFNKMKGVKK